MENVLGIYRNYCLQKKTTKCYIIFQIIAQNILHSSVVISEAHFLLGVGNDCSKIKFDHALFSFLTYLNYLSSVVTGIYHSRAFGSYFESITRISKCFTEDELNLSSKKTCTLTSAFIILVVVFCVYRSAEILLNYLQNDGDTDIIIFSSIFVSQVLIRITIVFQKIMLFVVIIIVVRLTKCLNSLVSAVQERVCSVGSDGQCLITKLRIQGWIDLYRELTNCCEKLTLCFGRQVNMPGYSF